jgi:hypothetical protein
MVSETLQSHSLLPSTLGLPKFGVSIVGHWRSGSNEIVRNFIGDSGDEFTVEINHGGFFVGFGKLRSYVDGKVSWFDHCESDT